MAGTFDGAMNTPAASLPQLVFAVPLGVQVLDLTGPIQVFYEAATYGQP